jgi:hypothetical protein
MPGGRRFLGSVPRLTGRSWEDASRNLEDFLRRLWDSEADGIPAGWGEEVTPSGVEAGSLGSPGEENTGWAAANHEHPVDTDIPEDVGVKIPQAEGTSPSLSRADHVHTVVTIRTVGFTVDGASRGPLTMGFKGFVSVPYSGTITGWWLKADQPGDCVVDVWKSDYRPTVLNSICGVAKPTLSSEMEATGDATGWSSLSVEVGDIFGFYVDSVATITLLTLAVQVRES